jgi:hypothetical protein
VGCLGDRERGRRAIAGVAWVMVLCLAHTIYGVSDVLKTLPVVYRSMCPRKAKQHVHDALGLGSEPAASPYAIEKSSGKPQCLRGLPRGDAR